MVWMDVSQPDEPVCHSQRSMACQVPSYRYCCYCTQYGSSHFLGQASYWCHLLLNQPSLVHFLSSSPSRVELETSSQESTVVCPEDAMTAEDLVLFRAPPPLPFLAAVCPYRRGISEIRSWLKSHIVIRQTLNNLLFKKQTKTGPAQTLAPPASSPYRPPLQRPYYTVPFGTISPAKASPPVQHLISRGDIP